MTPIPQGQLPPSLIVADGTSGTKLKMARSGRRVTGVPKHPGESNSGIGRALATSPACDVTPDFAGELTAYCWTGGRRSHPALAALRARGLIVAIEAR